MFPASRQRLVPHSHGPAAQGRRVWHFNNRALDHRSIRRLKGNHMKSHLEEKHEELVSRREGLLTKFTETARTTQPDAPLGELFDRIQTTNEFLHSLDRIAGEVKEEPNGSVPRYTVS